MVTASEDGCEVLTKKIGVTCARTMTGSMSVAPVGQWARLRGKEGARIGEEKGEGSLVIIWEGIGGKPKECLRKVIESDRRGWQPGRTALVKKFKSCHS